MKRMAVFSVIILHYNQKKYWKDCIDSVLIQDYPFIELIFADDATPDFDVEEVKKYVQRHAKDNIIAFRVSLAEKNQGTVANINRADQYVTGDYIYHMAADDVLANDMVLSNFVLELEKASANICGVYGRSIVCDEYLNSLDYDYISKEQAMRFNSMGSKSQYEELSKRCCFPMAAMAFKRENYMRYVPHDDRYTLIEDWPFLLRITRMGEKFWFSDFPVILYRAGGVSRPLKRNLKVEQWSNRDYVHIYDIEIWPYCKRLSLKTVLQIAREYDYKRTGMQRIDKNLDSIKRIEIAKHSVKYILVLIYRIFSDDSRDQPSQNLDIPPKLKDRLIKYLFEPKP